MVLNECNLDSFVETSQFVKVKRTLDKERVVIIVGTAGEGKSTTALALTSSVDKGRFLIINNPNQIEQIGPKAADLIIIDDIFGRYYFDQNRFSDWKARLDILQSVLKANDVKVIITTRTEIWRRCYSEMARFEIFNHIVELCSSSVSSKEKMKILEKHIQINGRALYQQNIEEYVEFYMLPFGFPLCASMFAAQTDLFLTQGYFFKLPYSFIKDILTSMEKEMYVTLLFLFYKNNRCLDIDLKPQKRLKMADPTFNANLLKSVAKLVGINPAAVSLPFVRDTLDSLTGILVKYENKVYSFIDRTVYDCVTFYHAETYLEEVVEHCTMEFLCRYVDTDDSKTKHSLIIEPDSYGILAERIIKEVTENRSFEPIINLSALESESFCTFLVKALDESQQMLFLSGDGDDSSRKGFLETFIESKPDHSCINIVTQFLYIISKSDNQTWYEKLKEDVRVHLSAEGHNATLEALCKAGILPNQSV